MLAIFLLGVLGANPSTTTAVESEVRPPARPGRHMVEVGLGLGAFIPSSNHELYDSTTAPQSNFDALGANAVLRASYFPLSFIGVEGELGLSPIGDEADDTDLLYTARGHLMLQYPGRVAPFILGGGGMLGVDSPRGGDADRAAHWGVGVKYYAKPWLSFRVDGRHLVSAAEGPDTGNTNHFEALVGVSVTLFRAPERRKSAPMEIAVVDDLPEPEPEPEPEVAPEPVDANRGLAEVDPIDVIKDAMSDVQFAFDSAEVHPSQHSLLDRIYDALKSVPEVTLVITGHTCSIGTERYNLDLSRRRAEAVRRYLVGRGIASTRVRVEGAGEAEPEFSNEVEETRARNRRTDFEVRANVSGGSIAGRP